MESLFSARKNNKLTRALQIFRNWYKQNGIRKNDEEKRNYLFFPLIDYRRKKHHFFL